MDREQSRRQNIGREKDRFIVDGRQYPRIRRVIGQRRQYKGGLGAYFGDKLEGLADIGLESYRMQPGYSHVRKGKDLIKVDYESLIKDGTLIPVLTGKDAIEVIAWAEDPTFQDRVQQYGENVPVKVEVYKLNRGGSWDFLLMSEVFDELYGGPICDEKSDMAEWLKNARRKIHRFSQEIVFGKAAYKLMRALELKPDILHLNEAHTVVAAAQVKSRQRFR